MTAITKERVEELRAWLTDTDLGIRGLRRHQYLLIWQEQKCIADLLSILSSHDEMRAELDLGNKAWLIKQKQLEKMRAEVKRLNTWHTTLSESWKARAEKAEAELTRAEDRHHIDLMELRAQEAQLAKVCERNKLMDENFGSLLEKNINLEEQLAKQRPLIEAVMAEDAEPSFIEVQLRAHMNVEKLERLLRAALALRMEKK